MRTEKIEHVEYSHRMEYRTLDEHGKWSEPVYRYLNPTTSLKQARRRHMECHPVEYRFGRKFEGIYGYSYGECTLSRKTTRTVITEDEIA